MRRDSGCQKGFAVVGKPVVAVDGVEKVTGRARFTVDITRPGMLWGAVLRSPLPHARVLHVDAQRALRLPGVRVVLTGMDLPRRRYGNLVQDQHVLAFDKVRYVGDEVAVVAATDADTAREALELIRVDYDPLPAVFDPEEAMRDGAPLVHDAENNIAHRTRLVRGDVDEMFRRCQEVVEEFFETPRVHQAYLEPQACVAELDEWGRIQIWCGTQVPGRIRFQVAQALDIPVGRVRVNQMFVGGAFGGKTYQHVVILAAALALRAGVAVKMVYGREEDFSCTLPRVPMRIWLRLGADGEGRLLAKEMRIVADNGAYSVNAPAVLDTAATRVDNLYRIPAVRTDALLVYTNNLPTGMFRGFGNPQSTFAVESAMDMLAERLGIDPVEMRLRNATQAGDLTVHGWKIKSCGLSDCLRAVAQRIGWTPARRPPARIGLVPGGRYRGVGFACVIHVNGNRSVFAAFEGSSARIRLDESGCAYVNCSCGDIGQGASTIYAQIAAEVLTLPMTAVRVERTDTDQSGFGLGAYASRVTVLAGNAVRIAAEDLRRRILEFVADLRGVPVTGLELRDGRVVPVAGKGDSRMPAGGLELGEVAREFMYRHGGQILEGTGFFAPGDVVIADKVTKYGNISATYTFGAQAVEVEVDAETGRVTCTRVVAAYDLGTVINPLAAEGQVEGGVVQGLGFALTELLQVRDGRVLNPDFRDYKMYTTRDVPPVEVLFLGEPDPVGPFGAKGVGEPALVPTIAAVANAIYNATGVRLKRVPFMPEDVLHTLGNQIDPPVWDATTDGQRKR